MFQQNKTYVRWAVSIVVFSEECSTSILMTTISNILFCKSPAISFGGFFPLSSASNLVPKVSGMDKVFLCLPVDSGTLRFDGLDMKTL